MVQKRIFTVNKKTHPNMNSMMNKYDIYFVPLIDVGVSTSDHNAIDMGTDMNCFLRSPHDSKRYYVG